MESETLTGRELGQLFLEARRRRGNIDSGPETTLEPFQFFELPYDLQRQIMIEELSLESVKNLCAAAATSKQFQSFLQDICNNVEVWRSKFKYDFPDVYPESLRAAEGENINDLVRYWRDEYEEELRDTPVKMIEYIENNDILKVRKYLRLGVDTEQLISYVQDIFDIYFDIQEFYDDDGNLEDLPKMTLLMWAVFLERREIIKDLIEAGANVNAKGPAAPRPRSPRRASARRFRRKISYGDTPLILAVKENNLEIIRDLIQAGADPNEGEGELLLKVENTDVLQELVNLGADIEKYGGKALTLSENFNLSQKLLELGADPNYTFIGQSPLLNATEDNNTEMIKLLLNYGADINIQDKEDGWTPLMVAAYKGHVDLVRFLLKNGANPRLRSFEDKTAYDWALEARNIQPDIVEILESGVSLED